MNKTDKIYQENSYLTTLEASVISCIKKNNIYELIFNKTIFYPTFIILFKFANDIIYKKKEITFSTLNYKDAIKMNLRKEPKYIEKNNSNFIFEYLDNPNIKDLRFICSKIIEDENYVVVIISETNESCNIVMGQSNNMNYIII